MYSVQSASFAAVPHDVWKTSIIAIPGDEKKVKPDRDSVAVPLVAVPFVTKFTC